MSRPLAAWSHRRVSFGFTFQRAAPLWLVALACILLVTMADTNEEEPVAAPPAEDAADDAADGDDHVPEEENNAHFEPVVSC